ncbi:hypothetical protein GCM10019016_079800 [Streptomyces prasinosporus]|uniref:Uncharacterized protein n=1 Tax=Streptomyces prasinosporus TaxID=68256 RepID=A0ABP6U1Q1_9ACTN|nr:hypothetical protein GCM10010332_50010 [Streptomyces albogriseolus]
MLGVGVVQYLARVLGPVQGLVRLDSEQGGYALGNAGHRAASSRLVRNQPGHAMWMDTFRLRPGDLGRNLGLGST